MKELHISEFSFHEFLQRFQDAVLNGYSLDLESNERFPQKFGSHLYVIMVKPESINETLNLPTTLVTEEPVTELPKEEVPIVASLDQVQKLVEQETTTPTRTRKVK